MDKTTKQIASLCRKIQKIWNRDDMLNISITQDYISFFSLEHNEIGNYIIQHTEFKEVKNKNSNN